MDSQLKPQSSQPKAGARQKISQAVKAQMFRMEQNLNRMGVGGMDSANLQRALARINQPLMQQGMIDQPLTMQDLVGGQADGVA